jgi:hypothetical protein
VNNLTELSNHYHIMAQARFLSSENMLKDVTLEDIWISQSGKEQNRKRLN